MTKIMIPSTKPNWARGRFAVQVNDELQGYFRLFQSAWNWKRYLQSTLPSGRVLILENGQIVNVGNCGENELSIG